MKANYDARQRAKKAKEEARAREVLSYRGWLRQTLANTEQE